MLTAVLANHEEGSAISGVAGNARAGVSGSAGARSTAAIGTGATGVGAGKGGRPAS